MDESTSPTTPAASSIPALPPVAGPGEAPAARNPTAEDDEPTQVGEGAQLLDELRQAIARYVILPNSDALTLSRCGWPPRTSSLRCSTRHVSLWSDRRSGAASPAFWM
ncbi:hypothetical protein GCM10017776_38920 [Streptomyces griseoluteus]|nr:hypothetical protein GCM10017776_38920 [Streptomyces griseoluteus]